MTASTIALCSGTLSNPAHLSLSGLRTYTTRRDITHG